MYLDATVGINRYTLTLRIDPFWHWYPWYVWENTDQMCTSLSLGFFELEFRRPLTKKEKKALRNKYAFKKPRS